MWRKLKVSLFNLSLNRRRNKQMKKGKSVRRKGENNKRNQRVRRMEMREER